jgi:hypothetical protein
MNTTLAAAPAERLVFRSCRVAEFRPAFLNGLFHLKGVGFAPARLVRSELIGAADHRAGERKVGNEQPGRRPWHN